MTEHTLQLKNLVSAELEELADDLDREATGHDTGKLRQFAKYLDSTG
jgi:hypothetical protein